ncbi:MAG: undecaprenyldiphospho-muramoylpentapeptide beta-N-acetylglucosaminyltransferase [Coriobacteriaceae bacterium]|nr:undecaprenyldiphospho-muramoylpentapeptide beta-N-acetylglucosaminyltransferase [Coriobacteriaceae bacterium]
MRFVITGGGTAGHINPALAVAEELSQRGHEVLFAGTPSGLEATLAPKAGLPYQAFSASGFDRARPTTLISSSVTIARSACQARRWLKRLQSDAVIGFGGYVSIPVGLAASWSGVPLIIHEQNSAAGLANRFLARKAAAIALTYPQAQAGLKTTRTVHITGNPVRPSLLGISREEARQKLGVGEDAQMLLVFGGSLGAQHINQALLSQAKTLMERPDLHVYHITGTRDFKTTYDKLALQFAAVETDRTDVSICEDICSATVNARWHLESYCNRMGEVLAAADVVISRAGATSLAEISAIAVPALLVPYPYATDDHQTTNAKAMVESGAALMIRDSELDSPRFSELMMELLNSSRLRDTMKQAARVSGSANATVAVAELAIAAAKSDAMPD